MNVTDIQNQLSEKLTNLFVNEFDKRKEYYKAGNKRPSKSEINSLISSYANNNALVSGGSGLIPGPFGMAAAIPEIVLIMKNQINMVYDIGVANGKEKKMNTELMLYIFMTSMGNSGVGLATIQGSKILVKRASLKVMQQIIAMLGGKVTQKLLKSMVAKWLPLVGAAAMAAWSRYSTFEIGKKANELFNKDIEVESEDESKFDDFEVVDETPQNNQANPDIEMIKIQILMNLMKSDGNIASEEKDFIKPIIDNANIKDAVKKILKDNVETDKKFNIDLSLIKGNEEDVSSLLIDMIALAKKDGDFDPNEELYIREIADKLGTSDVEIDLMLQ